MYIVIVGAGRIGAGLAESMIAAGQEVYMLDRDPERIEQLRARFGSVAGLGDGTSVASLREAGVSRAGLFVAVTDDDAENLAACQLAKHTFNVTKTVALAMDTENATLFDTLGVDDVVSLTDLAMSRLSAAVPAHPVVRLMPLAGRNREVISIKIPAGGTVVNRKLSELVLPYGSSVVLVVNPNGQIEDPRPDTLLGADDEVIAVSPVESTQALWETLTEMS